MSATIYLIAALIVLLGLIGGGVYVHHHGYIAGQNERTAHYAALMQAANDAKDKANERVDRQDKAARTITEQSEKDHALLTQTLLDRTSTADARIAALLRQRAASDAGARRCTVPTVPNTAGESAGTPASDPRNERLAGSVSRVGGQCEHDADELAEFQQWYARQKAAIDTMN
jgi:hypothetical protein